MWIISRPHRFSWWDEARTRFRVAAQDSNTVSPEQRSLIMRSLPAACTLLVLLAACSQPPPDAYVGGSRLSANSAKGLALGKDAAGEVCVQLPSGTRGVTDVFCGNWTEPAARVQSVRGTSGTVADLATGGPWRLELDHRYACAPPVSTTILGGAPAEMLQCTRRVGGWPQVALVASLGGEVYLAEGILPALPAIERGIGVLSGRVAAGTANLPPSAVDALLARQLAAHAFSAGDVGEYERLMALGARANLADDFATAETAYRAALALQQKALGRTNPDTVNPLMHLALQLSDQGRFADADALFTEADTLAPRATDRAAPARLLHYRALHLLNEGQTAQALALLTRADAAYATLVPAESLHQAVGTSLVMSRSVAAMSTGAESGAGLADLPSQRLMFDPTAQSALMGLIETRRYRAVALRQLGHAQQADSMIASADALAAANQMAVPLVSARLTRTEATVGAAGGEASSVGAVLARAQEQFTDVLPGTRPVAETALLQAAEEARQGRTRHATALCDQAVSLLRQLGVGVDPALLEPCLTADAAEAAHDPIQNQRVLASMFETAQLAQGSITSRQIEEAAARLAAGARNANVSDAIRRRQDAAYRLAQLYRQRDQLAHPRASDTLSSGNANVSPADLDKSIATAQRDLADADAALHAAAPNYGQLVQEVVPAREVLSYLKPGEAFAAITVTRDGGWTFLLRDGTIAVAPVRGNAASITALVSRLRASIELTNQLPAFDIATSRAIYDDTLGRLAPQLAGTRALVVAPSGALLALPFAVLLTGPASQSDLAGAPWLIRQMSVAHVPSAANFVALRKAGTSRAAYPWIGFGGFRPVTLAQARASFPAVSCRESAALLASLPPLTSAERELAAARQILGVAAGDELLDSRFTVPAVMHANLRDYRILHFATHALLPAELRCEDEPAIVTSAPPGARDASGALLTASDIVGLHLDANLVILSACNSGGPGGTVAGESLSGLARAFFYAGARSLLVTHWSVNDQTAAYLVVDTLNRLHNAPGQGTAEAMREAQLEMLGAAGQSMPAEVAHPFFWAPFAVIGAGSGATPQSRVAGL